MPNSTYKNRPKQIYALTCARCGRTFESRSSKARYCCAACKQAAYRMRREGVSPSL